MSVNAISPNNRSGIHLFRSPPGEDVHLLLNFGKPLSLAKSFYKLLFLTTKNKNALFFRVIYMTCSVSGFRLFSRTFPFRYVSELISPIYYLKGYALQNFIIVWVCFIKIGKIVSKNHRQKIPPGFLSDNFYLPEHRSMHIMYVNLLGLTKHWVGCDVGLVNFFGNSAGMLSDVIQVYHRFVYYAIPADKKSAFLYIYLIIIHSKISLKHFPVYTDDT